MPHTHLRQLLPTILLALTATIPAAALTPNDDTDLTERLAHSEATIDHLQATINRLQHTLSTQAQTIDRQQHTINSLLDADTHLQTNIDSTAAALTADSKQRHADMLHSLERNATDTNTRHQHTNTSLRTTATAGAALLALLALLGISAYTTLRRRLSHTTQDSHSIHDAHTRLQQQATDLDLRLTELYQRQLTTETAINDIRQHTATTHDDETDHTLILTIAGELTRIEQNLAFMDPTVRGLSQLRSRSTAIRNALADRGYDIPTLTGTEYHEGDMMEAVMEEDPNLDPGHMIVRRIIRPAVLYEGHMIQAAKAVVAYN